VNSYPNLDPEYENDQNNENFNPNLVASSNRLSNPKQLAKSVQCAAIDRYQSNENDIDY
jgi:hypothetical protein